MEGGREGGRGGTLFYNYHWGHLCHYSSNVWSISYMFCFSCTHDVSCIYLDRIQTLKSRLESLLPRVEGASHAANEAKQLDVAEDNLKKLEAWLVSNGKFSNNQHILRQIQEHKVEIEWVRMVQREGVGLESCRGRGQGWEVQRGGEFLFTQQATK